MSQQKKSRRIRHQARSVRRAGIAASGYDRYVVQDWLRAGGSPLEDIHQHLHDLRISARELYMGGSGLATGALKTLRTNVVGTGLQLHCIPDTRVLGISPEQAAEWAYFTERRFALWADSTDCDAAGLNTFAELQQLAMLSWVMSGDVFALLPILPRAHSPYDLRVKLIEADRVCNPGNYALNVAPQVARLENGRMITQGVEIDATGCVVAYHVARKHPLSMQYLGDAAAGWDRVEVRGAATGRRNMLHLMTSERPEQYRGVPLLAPVLAALKQLGRYIDAELIAAVVSGMFAAFIVSEATGARGAVNPRQIDPRTGSAKREPINLEPGLVLELNPGESVQTVASNRPNTAFDGFLMAATRIIGSAVEIPAEVLMKSFNASYSASRASLLEFWKGCKMWRHWLSADFNTPVFHEWLTEDIARGNTEAPGYFESPVRRQAWARAVWHGPAPGHIQPLQEAKASTERIANGTSTGAQEAREYNGSDYLQNIAEQGIEHQARLNAGLPPLFDAPADTAGLQPVASLDDDPRFLALADLLGDDPEMLDMLTSIQHEYAAMAAAR